MTTAAKAFIHPLASVETSSVGDDTRVWAFAHVLKGAVLGRNCNVGDHCFIENDVRIGDSVVIKNGVSVWDGVTIEDFAFVGPNAVFTNDLRPRAKGAYELARTLVRHHATIGANATIVAGVTIGEYALVGAGSVVTRDVPPFACVVGNPARFHHHVCRCAQKLVVKDTDAACPHCGAVFRREGSAIREA